MILYKVGAINKCTQQIFIHVMTLMSKQIQKVFLVHLTAFI